MNGQNLISNPGFEDYTALPVSLGQVTNAIGWDMVILSADYVHDASYTGWSPQTGGAYAGQGSMGFATYGDANGSCEAVGQDISASPLLPGVAYSYDLFAKMSPSGSYSSVCGGVEVYGFTSTPAMGFAGEHPVNMPGAILLFTTTTIDSDLWEQRSGCFNVSSTINYIVYCLENTPNCAQYVYVDDLSIDESGSSFSLGPDETLCISDTFELDITMANATYLWQDGTTNPTMSVNQTGEYWVEVTSSCGVQSDTLNIVFEEPIVLDIGSDLTSCIGTVITLSETSVSGNLLTWNDVLNGNYYSINSSGSYWVTTTNSCGLFGDTLNAVFEECETEENIPFEIEMPNVFSPNYDQVNDFFTPVVFKGVYEHRLLIFNRWGNLMYESDFLPFGWDGKSEGELCAEGTYFWIVEAKDSEGNDITLDGFVTLIY